MSEPAPPMSPRRRRWWLPVAFVAGAGVLVGATLLISNTLGHSSATAASTTPAAPVTTTTVDTPITTEDQAVTPGQVDAIIASDGHPLDLAGGLTPYPDAYALIKDDCDTMASQPVASTWLAAHMLNAAVPGEAAAIRVGVPLVCPQFSPAVLAVEGGTGG